MGVPIVMGGSLYSYGNGDPGSLISYECRDPGPHSHMRMGTRGPQCRGSPFPRDTGTTSTVADLQDVVARAVTTALRDHGYAVDSEDEADSARLLHS